MGESTFSFRGIRSNISFFLIFSIHFLFQANRIAPDGTSRFAASHMRLFCIRMPHKKDTRLIWVKIQVCDLDVSSIKAMINYSTDQNKLNRAVGFCMV